MKDKLIIAGVVVAVVFTIVGYSQTNRLSQEVAALEKDMAALVETQKNLTKELEKMSTKVLVSDKVMSFIEELTKTLKAKTEKPEQPEKAEEKK